MNTLILAVEWGGWQGILLKVAIACVIIWGVWELIKWAGIAIPRPVIIVFTCLICILIIYWLFQLFNALV